MELNVQKYLRQYSLEKLNKDLEIKISRHGQYPNLVQLKYCGIKSPKLNPMVVECRGLILDEDNNWEIIAYPYNRFFNYGETGAAVLDTSSTRIYEKLDGSLCTVYYYDNSWHVATSGMPDANGSVQGFNMTFAELFWETWYNHCGYASFNCLDPHKRYPCYMFELMTPYNMIVVPHSKSDIVLHGIRDLETLQEKPIDDFVHTKTVHQHNFSSLEEALEVSEKLDPVKSEGFILVDKHFNRIKIKSPKYVALHRIKSCMSPNNMVNLIRVGEVDEFLNYFPQYSDLYHEINNKIEEVINKLDDTWYRFNSIKDDKKFAIAITNHLNKNKRLTGIIFSMRKGYIDNIRDGFFKNDDSKILKTIGYKNA